MPAMRLFIPITKVDADNRIVHGVATAESPDRSGEICDYESTKPFYEKWSGEIEKATGGKSLGNVRAMHGRVAAGKLTAIDFDDDNKKIAVAAKIVDDDEWAKVLEGVYTGFSQGGEYVARWADKATGLTRYTANPHEISIVDLPCLPDSTFQIVKDGVLQVRKFAAIVAEPRDEAILARALDLSKAAGKTDVDPFVPQARAELLKEAMASTEAVVSHADDEDSAADGEGVGSPEVAAKEPAAKAFEPAPIWDCGCAGHKHAKKAHAVKCMKTRADAELAKASPSPLAAALEKLEAIAGGAKAEPPDAIAAAIDALFSPVAKRTFSADDRKAAAKAGTAMADGSFPIENKDDLENAIRAYGRAKDKEGAKKHIEERAKALGATDMLPENWTDAAKMAAGALAKGLYDVSQFADIINQISYLYQWAINERAYEGDDSTVPDDLCHLLRSAGEILVRWASEEIAELMPDGAAPAPEVADAMALAAGLNEAQAEALHKLSERCGAPFAVLAAFRAPDEPIEKLFASFEKKGARNSKADQDKIQAIHDHSMSLGAGCSKDNCGKDGASGDDLAKALQTENATLKQEIADAAKQFDGLSDSIAKRFADMDAEIVKLKAQPMPAKAAITVVEKGAGAAGDGGAAGTGNTISQAEKALDAMTSDDLAMFLTKAALRNGKRFS